MPALRVLDWTPSRTDHYALLTLYVDLTPARKKTFANRGTTLRRFSQFSPKEIRIVSFGGGSGQIGSRRPRKCPCTRARK